MPKAILRLSVEYLGSLLALPQGVEIVDIFFEPRTNTMGLKLSGNRFPATPEGGHIHEVGLLISSDRGTELSIGDEVLYRSNPGAVYLGGDRNK